MNAVARVFARANEDRKEHRSNSRTLPKETPKAEETSLDQPTDALMACLQRWEEQPDKPIEQDRGGVSKSE